MKKNALFNSLGLESILLVSVFLTSLISAFNLSTINKELASINNASYDFIVSGFINQSDEQKLIDNSDTLSFNRTINFNLSINSNKTGNVLLSRDPSRFNLSLLDSKVDLTTFNPNSDIFIDEVFSRYHGVREGDEIRFTLNGNLITLNVFKVILHTPLSNFLNGIAYGVWNQNFETFFSRYLVSDYTFVQTLNQTIYESFLNNNNFSYLNREALLNDQTDIRTNQYSYFLVIPIIVNILLLLLKIYLLNSKLSTKTKEFLVALKEDRINDNITYKNSIHNSVIISFVAFLFSQINLYFFVSYLDLFWIVLLSNFVFYILNYYFTVNLTNKYITRVIDLIGNLKSEKQST
jgi:hypothetical protein